MSQNSEKILNLIDTFQIRRAREINGTILKSITARKEREGIRDLFISEKYLQDDKNGHLASFVVLSPNNTPLIFFSLRCGELFEKIYDSGIEFNREEVSLGQQAYLDFRSAVNENDIEKAKSIITNIEKQGLSFNDIITIDQRKRKKYDQKKFKDIENTNKVLISYPAVELKLFGINESAKDYWNALNLPEEIRMGETLFWLKVVKTIEEMTKYVGCQYVYLFAADEKAEGKLVQYYRTRLGFDSETNLSTNKPSFDWNCQFLFQKTDNLFEKRDEFIQLIQK
jgi:hypothetical protein